MSLFNIDSIGELAVLIGSALGTVIFTIGGLLVDHAGITNVLAGQIPLGAWELWIGTTALIVGLYLFGYRELWHRLHQIQHSD